MLSGLGSPFVGNGVTSSAISMDKDYTKKIAASVGVAVADGVVLHPGRYEVTPVDRERLGLPVFVKPAREGSSIGVSRVEDWAELPDAVDLARKSGQPRSGRHRPRPGADRILRIEVSEALGSNVSVRAELVQDRSDMSSTKR
jgi:D-alanine-D-alanine ligase-like ATP-grasp enzyme